jgi:hypothetical protein
MHRDARLSFIGRAFRKIVMPTTVSSFESRPLE